MLGSVAFFIYLQFIKTAWAPALTYGEVSGVGTYYTYAMTKDGVGVGDDVVHRVHVNKPVWDPLKYLLILYSQLHNKL